MIDLKVNEIPTEVWNLLPHDEYVLYSFDVTKDKSFAVFALCSQDPDFPEIWIYDNSNNNLIPLESVDDTLIDFPMGKVIWAENQHDIIVVSCDDPPACWLYTLDESFANIAESSEKKIIDISNYLKNKLGEVKGIMFE